MRRLFVAGALAVGAGCAHTAPVPAMRGTPDAEGLVPMTAVIERESESAPWAPSAAYPTLNDDRGHRGPRSQPAARGPVIATGWLAYRGYQETFSRVDGATCRFRPTCSEFAMQAVEAYGPFGVVLALGRLHRAHGPERHYVMVDPPFLADALSDYTFWLREPRLDDFDAYAHPAHAWFQHVRAAKAARR